MAEPLTHQEFSEIMSAGFASALSGVKAVAVGVSGGPDSMALVRLLSEWSDRITIHALSVDHGLREGSDREAAQVGESVQGWANTQHQVLTWRDSAESRIQEEARRARYALMAEYCKEQGISHLFLAHHQDDQAETFLFRLAKGSGLDGLACMRPQQPYSDDLTLMRPLLDIPKDRLVVTCQALDISYVKDPTNQSEDFARPRLRKSAAVLEEEGLTPKRLSSTARRLARARAALEELAEELYKTVVVDINTDRIVLNYSSVAESPSEIAFRVILKAVESLRIEQDYAPRMEKLEDLFEDMMAPNAFRKRTLGGVVFERDDKKGHVVLSRENAH